MTIQFWKDIILAVRGDDAALVSLVLLILMIVLLTVLKIRMKPDHLFQIAKLAVLVMGGIAFVLTAGILLLRVNGTRERLLTPEETRNLVQVGAWHKSCSNSQPESLTITPGTPVKTGSCRIFQTVATEPRAQYVLSFKYRDGCVHAFGANENPIAPGENQGDSWRSVAFKMPALSTSTKVMIEECNTWPGDGKGGGAEVDEIKFSKFGT